MLKRRAILLPGIILFVSLTATLMYAAAAADEKAGASQTVTGCLQKGLENKGFFLLTADGQHWELYPSSKVSLADHVGHTVTVTGTVAKRSPAQEEKSQPYEKKEITGKGHADLQVSSVKMVSETCSK
jgi:hypothetical protein